MEYQNYIESLNYIRERCNIIPKVAFIFGSGLGQMKEINISHRIDYKDIPNFPISTAPGHSGQLVFGELNGIPYVAQLGRFHYYEGYSGKEIIFGVRIMSMLGAKTLFVSNAAGGVNYDFKVGDLMIIEDHINLLPNPLIGKNESRFGVRFPDMTNCYSKRLIDLALAASVNLGFHIHQGIYLASTGPSFETKAEYNFFRIAGADAVGMSTTSEIIAAQHIGMECFGISVITNTAYDFNADFTNDGNDVIKVANNASEKLFKIFNYILSAL